MNKRRIREPFHTLIWKASIGYNDSWSQVDPEVLEKFAELIVRECVQSIERTIETSCEFDSEKMGCEFAITDLKKHFGVEK